MAINRLYTPTPPTAEEIVEINKKHQEALQKIYDKCDDKIVEAKLYYVKGTENFTKPDNILLQRSVDERDAYEGIVVVGTERQRCMDKTFPNITGIYSYNLTEDMLKRYEANDNKLIII
tara:strand:+ start:897 stop:1253 length:357 start_codon:yes stop_codon:yes gene_type:complete